MGQKELIRKNRSLNDEGGTMLKKAAIYARYSCGKQTEQSIEGQIRVINEFAQRNGYTIVTVYIDRAKSAKTANRPQFLQMIQDSAKNLFDFVKVYKLDRFSRNLYDSAFYMQKLKQNGVQVVSATECLSDNPEIIITEAMLEAMAEFYSAYLGQKTRIGMRQSALKYQMTGQPDIRTQDNIYNECRRRVPQNGTEIHQIQADFSD